MSKMKATYGEPKDNYTAKLRTKSTILFIWFVILTIICLLPIYILIINATRAHTEIANSLSFLPGTHFFDNMKTLKTNPTLMMAYDAFHGYKNSLIITVSSCFLTVFFYGFCSITAAGIVDGSHAPDTLVNIQRINCPALLPQAERNKSILYKFVHVGQKPGSFGRIEGG